MSDYDFDLVCMICEKTREKTMNEAKTWSFEYFVGLKKKLLP